MTENYSDEFWTAAQVAEFCDVTTWIVGYWARNGLLPYKLRKCQGKKEHRVFNPVDVEEWIRTKYRDPEG